MTDAAPPPPHAPPSPPWPPRGELPADLTSFVGRAREIEEIGALLRGGARLLTLTGAGGSGKTRLGLEVAGRAERGGEVPVRWVELAGLSDPALLPQYVTEQLGLRHEGPRTATEMLLEQLVERRLLLVLDNCEHLVDACAHLAEALLRRCPGLQVLATSREALGIGGERAWLVPPLSLGATDAAAAPGEAPVSEAVQLFVARAQEVHTAFALAPANAGAIRAICQRLDGLPLAIELAAARVRVLSPEQIVEHLDDRFRLLTAGRRTALPRQQTLRATIDWSFALLGEDERVLLARLSVFRGGFSLDAVEAVCADEQVSRWQVLELVARLVDRSLLEMREVELTARYALLETVRQYAAERLRERGEEALHFGRHADFYTALVAAAEPHLTGTGRPRWIARLQHELDNVREALVRTREHAPGHHLRLVGMLAWFWYSTGYWSEGQRWAEDALALPAAAAPTRERGAVLFAAGMLAALQARTEEARVWLEESVALAGAGGDRRLEAYARAYLGMALIQRGDAAGAPPAHDALGWFRAEGDLYGTRLVLLLLGTCCAARGDLEGAVERSEEAVAVARAFGLPRDLGIALQVLGTWLLQAGATARARDVLRESLMALREDPQHLFLARGLEVLGAAACEQGDDAAALRFWSAAESVREQLGAARFGGDGDRVLPRIERVRARTEPRAFAELWAEGKRWSLAHALDRAIEWADPAAGVAPPAVPTVEAPAGAERQAGAGAGLRVRALGALEIAWDRADALPASSSFRPFELLLFLLCRPEGCTRDEVGAALWPGSSPAQVKNSFHVLLHRLRGATGSAELVVRDGERYRVNPGLAVWFDAAAFEDGAAAALRGLAAGDRARGELEAALALYRGDFLEDAVVGGWRLEIHDRLRRLYVDGLLALADLQMGEGDFRRAAATLERTVRKDELREEAHRRLMLCHAHLDQRERALQHYARLADLLRDELGEEPEPETRALAERIRSAPAGELPA